ncbi:MAG: LapA family protein [Nitrospinota bacterium]
MAKFKTSILFLLVKLIIALAALLLIVTVEAKNNYNVKVSWYFGYEYETSLWIVMVAAFVVGLLLSGIGWMFSAIRLFIERSYLNRQVSKLNLELEQYKEKELN